MYFIIGLLLSSIIFVQAEFHRFEFNITSDVVNPDCFETGVKVPHINGQFPGPAIYVQQGDKVEIIVRNQMNDFNTSIHYHGIRQIGSVDSDGVPGVTQIPIHPGSFYTQRFKVTQQAGTYFYHAHVGLQDDSVQGSFIVYESDLANPKKTAGLLQAGPYRYKKDLVLQLSEWWHEPLDSRQAYYTSSSFTFDHGSDSILMNGRTVFDPTAQSEKSCQGYTTFDVEPNTVYRLRVIGANSFRTLALAIKHHNLTMIEVDGELIHPHETSYLEITPGQRFSVLLKTADHPVGSTFAIGTSYLWRQRGRGVTENGFGYIRYVRPSQITEENSTALFKPILRWNGKKNGFDKRDDLIDSDNSRFEGRRGENDRSEGNSHHNESGRSEGNREEHGRSGNNHDDNNRSGGNREEHGRVEDSPRGVRPGGNREEHGRSGGNHDDNNRSGGNRDDNNRSGGNREESNLSGDNREELGRVEGNPRGDFGGHRGGGRSDGNREGGRSEGNREEHGSVEDGPRGEFGGRPGGGRPGGGRPGGGHGGGDGGGRVGGGEGGGGRQGGGGGQWGGGGGRPPRKEKVYEDLPLFPKVDEPDWIWHKLKPLAERNPILDEIDVRTITLVTSTMKMEDNTTRYLVNHRHTPMGYEPLTETFKQCKNPTYTNDQDEYNEELGTYRLSHNEVVDLVFQNTKNAVGGCLLHPWHTHGHSHYVIASGLGSYQHEKDKHIRNFENPIFKDTTVVYPSIPKEETEGCGWTKVRIIADNPGFWAVHCHITTHMIQGKMIILEEAPKLISKYNLYPRN